MIAAVFPNHPFITLISTSWPTAWNKDTTSNMSIGLYNINKIGLTLCIQVQCIKPNINQVTRSVWGRVASEQRESGVYQFTSCRYAKLATHLHGRQIVKLWSDSFSSKKSPVLGECQHGGGICQGL